MRPNVSMTCGLAVAVVLAAATGCCKRPPPIQSQQGTLEIQDGTHDITGRADDFGNVCPQGSSTRTLSLANSSTVDVTVKAISVSGGGFTAPSLPIAPFAVTAGATVPLPIDFSPPGQGPVSGKLTVQSDAENGTVSATLTGTGQSGAAQPTYDASCGYLHNGQPVTRGYPCDLLLWDGVIVGSHADDTLSISDDGCPPLQILTATLSAQDGGSAAAFSLPGLPPLPANVAPGSPLALTVRYTPAAANGFDQATLTLTTNDPTNSLSPAGTPGVFVYNLAGAGVASSVQLTPPTYDFGAVTQGVSASATFTVTNTGSLPVTLAVPTLANGAPPFSIGSSWSAGTTLAPVTAADGGSSLGCQVVFTSPGTGLFQDQLTVTYSSQEGSGTATATVVAHAGGQLCASPDPLQLGPVSYCGRSQGTLVLGNCGNADLHIQALGFADGGNPLGSFTVQLPNAASLPVTLAPDAGVALLVGYADQGRLDDPLAVLLVQTDAPGSPDAGSQLTILAQASAVPLPVDSPLPAPDAGVGVGVTTAFVPVPGNDAPLYAYSWALPVKPAGSAPTFASDGGMAWLTPDKSGTYYVCLGEAETPLPDGGANCGFDAGASSHCDQFIVP